MTNEQAIEKAKSRLNMCDYQSEMLNNPGLSEAYRREGEWLRVVLRLAMQATDVCNRRAERTGRWIEQHDYPGTYSRCSACDQLARGYAPIMKFCPNCGAHMIGGAEHD